MLDEFNIELGSGVWNTLTAMPYFAAYQPDAKNDKLKTEYSLWGRAVLDFAPECESSITDAVDVLQ